MALVVLGEPQLLGHLRAEALQPPFDLVGDPQLLARPRRHRRRERTDALRPDAEVGLEQPYECRDRLVVVHDSVDTLRSYVTALQAVRDRLRGERGVVLL